MECEGHPNVVRQVVFILHGFHHLFLQVINRVEKLLSFGCPCEAVDVDNRDGVSELVKPVLDVRHPPCV